MLIVKGRRSALGAAVFGLFTGVLGGLLLAPVAEAGLVIRARSNGIPGKPAGAQTEQRLLVGAGLLRFEDLSSPKARFVIVRLDSEVFWEVDPALEEYTETAFQHLRDQREAAERDRENARELALKKLSGADLEEWLKKHRVRRDGKRVLDVSRGGWEILDGVRAQRISIEVNGVTQVAAWQTDKYKEYKPPRELFDFYDKTGLFAAEVIEALKREVTLFPVRIVADIDLFKKGTVIETDVQAVSAWPDDPAKFEEPKAFRKVKEFSEEKVEKKEYRCPVCGKPVDPVASPVSPERDRKTGEKVFFDTDACWAKFLQRN